MICKAEIFEDSLSEVGQPKSVVGKPNHEIGDATTKNRSTTVVRVYEGEVDVEG